VNARHAVPRSALARGALVLLLAAAGAAAPAATGDEDGQTFAGSWSVSGQRQELPTEGARPAAIIAVSGTVALTRGDGLARGFRGEAIAFDDGRNLLTGRCVLTDDRGERIFATLTGDAPAPGSRVTGTITGGTGRYAGLSGTFTFGWQFVVRTGDGAFEARTTDLTGRYRRTETGIR
jgi:hypothetical protein